MNDAEIREMVLGLDVPRLGEVYADEVFGFDYCVVEIREHDYGLNAVDCGKPTCWARIDSWRKCIASGELRWKVTVDERFRYS